MLAAYIQQKITEWSTYTTAGACVDFSDFRGTNCDNCIYNGRCKHILWDVEEKDGNKERSGERGKEPNKQRDR